MMVLLFRNKSFIENAGEMSDKLLNSTVSEECQSPASVLTATIFSVTLNALSQVASPTPSFTFNW